MASLREIKDRIGSVRSTLKITNAMKLVASAKLRKAQQTIEGLHPYEATLASILSYVRAASPKAVAKDKKNSASGKTAVVVVASNSSLCGGFNANVVRKALDVISDCDGDVDVFAIGRKAADALRREGYPVPELLSGSGLNTEELVGHTDYEESTRFAQMLIDAFESGEYGRVLLVYSHFVSTSRQDVMCETYLPFDVQPAAEGDDSADEPTADSCDIILEPGAGAIVEYLMPLVMKLKIYTVLLDSVASEHAARTIAMQTASDNAKDILDELTLEYNKGRQQQITAELLDIVGGSQ